ncbi:hypothetical protein CYY_009499 [Polysphondylium violaceum]|uniref:Superoxide dismutase n=1 Tax=Polysphondylium violaceum TaxID=133409 RepID=A0A8J4PMW6_9MYCE|nr:hypothetical protein CYY_009499 [Polysphondylium violaceum]
MFSRIVVRVQRTAFADIQKRFKYTLPDVPYATTGISNFLSQNSVSEHLKLHKLDVERANNLIQRTPWENTTINQAIVQSSTSREDAPFFEAASSHFNHSFFWRSITDVKQTPSVYMKKAVEIDFGSFKDFQIKFSQNASALNVPGFTWLVFHDKALKIVNTFGNGSPLELRNCHPILCLDLFEHSYISDYQSNKNVNINIILL